MTTSRISGLYPDWWNALCSRSYCIFKCGHYLILFLSTKCVWYPGNVISPSRLLHLRCNSVYTSVIVHTGKFPKSRLLTCSYPFVWLCQFSSSSFFLFFFLGQFWCSSFSLIRLILVCNLLNVDIVQDLNIFLFSLVFRSLFFSWLKYKIIQVFYAEENTPSNSISFLFGFLIF